MSKSHDLHARTRRGGGTPPARQRDGRGHAEGAPDRAALEREAERNARLVAAAPTPPGSASAEPGALDSTLQGEMEGRLGHDFSQVRVHVGADAARSAAALDAAAFTIGADIVFNSGRFAPDSREGRQLLAHELTHVAQQRHMASPIVQRQSLGGGAAANDEQAAMLWESHRQSLSIEGFDSDKATLKPEHISQLDQYKQRLQTLLGLYPDSFFTIIGHTDATDSAERNKGLGQRRADAVKDYLAGGDKAVPANLLGAGSLGETALAVDTPRSEARNRRVEIIPTLRRRTFPFPAPAPSTPLPGPRGGAGEGGRPGPWTDPDPFGLGKPKPADVKLPEQNWLEDALKRDPLLKELPRWMRSKVRDALKDGDEKLAEKVIDALPLDDKTKAALQAIAKGLLQMAKGKRFKPPEAPPRAPEPGPPPQFPKFPGEVIIPGPKWEF